MTDQSIEQLIRSAKRGLIQRNRGTLDIYLRHKQQQAELAKKKERRKKARTARLALRIGTDLEYCSGCRKLFGKTEEVWDYIEYREFDCLKRETIKTYCDACHEKNQQTEI